MTTKTELEAGDTVTIDEHQYELVEFDEYRCQNCGRTTITALCGCGNPDHYKVGNTLIGLPVAAIGGSA